jgi:hypothetical protein
MSQMITKPLFQTSLRTWQAQWKKSQQEQGEAAVRSSRLPRLARRRNAPRPATEPTTAAE